MLRYFTCPDGVKREVAECLAKCQIKEGRCLSLPTLTHIGYTRTFKGSFSTTQLLNPTRLEYLQLTKPFTVDPFDNAFSLLGTRHHQMLEAVAKKIEGLEPEKYLKGDTTGILDLLEPLDDNCYRLIDYKTFGSYAVAKLLGLKENGDYDKYKLALQLNNYRVLVREIGFDVTEIYAQVTVRDGNTVSSKKNRVMANLYLIPVEIMPDDQIKEYFLSKAYALQTALDTGITELCNYEERWGGRRCKGYCSVAEFCPEGARVNKVALEK